MKCTNEITLKTGDIVPCGKCLSCRVNKRNSWNLRLRYEATQWPTKLFVGLTYEDYTVPFVEPSRHLTLRREDSTHFLERLRYRIKKDGYNTLRYYLIGEYGATTFRPHYHLQLFTDYPLGYPECYYAGEQDSTYCLSQCDRSCIVRHIRSQWYFGHSTCFPCTPADIGYITLLHVTGLKSPFPDVEPSFQRMSRRPGIGDCIFESNDHLQKVHDYLLPYTYTPEGTLTAIPRFVRDRIFTPAERKFLSLIREEDPSALIKAQVFQSEWNRNSWRAKGKI